jgi:hypothetical protein
MIKKKRSKKRFWIEAIVKEGFLEKNPNIEILKFKEIRKRKMQRVI